MKLRALIVLLLGVVACAVGVWFWPAPEESVAPASIPRPPAATPTPVVVAALPSPQPEATPQSSPPPGPTPPVRFDSPVMPGQPVYRSAPATPQRVVPAPAASGAPVFAAMKEPEGKDEVENVRAMFTNYVARIGEIPVGTNAEIMKSVMGGNRDRITLGPPHGQGLNEAGELVDRWGTPYFFHQMSKESMEVRSAGPDKTMWTPDDLVTK